MTLATGGAASAHLLVSNTQQRPNLTIDPNIDFLPGFRTEEMQTLHPEPLAMVTTFGILAISTPRLKSVAPFTIRRAEDFPYWRQSFLRTEVTLRTSAHNTLISL
jgi:hypothetical protein